MQQTQRGLIIGAVLISWLPYLFGWLICPQGMDYLWLIYNPDDQNVHLMWARQAMDGAWSFHDLFTTEPHPGLFVNLYALLLGWFCRFTGISLHFGYQIFRTVVAIVFLATAFWFGRKFLRTESAQKADELLVCFSSGLGWLPVLWWWQTGQRPPFYFVDVSPELTMPEANSFLSLCVAPLAALGVALVMLMLGNLHCALHGSDRRQALKAIAISALCGALVANVHSYAAIPMLLAIVIWQLSYVAITRKVQWQSWAMSILASVPCMVVLAVQAIAFSRDPAFAQKAVTPTLMPLLPVPFGKPLMLIGSYGLVALMAIGALPFVLKRLRQGETLWLLPLSWTLALLIAIHLPVSFQRKMIEGLHVALCLLTAITWEHLTQWLNERRPYRALGHWSLTHWSLAGLVIFTVPSQIAFFALNGYWMVHNNLIYEERFNPPYTRQLMPPYFIAETHLQLFRWIEKNSGQGDAVLCNPMLGNYLPSLTGRKVFIGHWAETLNFERKLKQATAIWRGELSPEEAQAFFHNHGIRYALETDFERGIANGATALRRYGRIVHRVDNDIIFELKTQ